MMTACRNMASKLLLAGMPRPIYFTLAVKGCRAASDYGKPTFKKRYQREENKKKSYAKISSFRHNFI